MTPNEAVVVVAVAIDMMTINNYNIFELIEHTGQAPAPQLQLQLLQTREWSDALILILTPPNRKPVCLLPFDCNKLELLPFSRLRLLSVYIRHFHLNKVGIISH